MKDSEGGGAVWQSCKSSETRRNGSVNWGAVWVTKNGGCAVRDAKTVEGVRYREEQCGCHCALRPPVHFPG